jgi:hypothetical protein
MTPCLINEAPRHEDIWGSVGIAPPFLISALDGGQWSDSHPGLLIPHGKNPLNQLDRRLGGPQNQPGRCGEEQSLLSPADNRTPVAQPVACLLY